MSLLSLQRGFGAWLRTGDAADAARVGTRYAPGLSVYQNNYRAQLVACLEASFPRTRQWLGEEAFLQAVVAHVDRVPPSSWTLDAYGRDFPETLGLLFAGDPEVRELAALELALEEAFVAPDHEVLKVAGIAAVDWDAAAIAFTPSLALSDLATNAPAIWSALVREETPPAAALLETPEVLLVWRSETVSCYRVIAPTERDALLLVRATGSFPALCEKLVEDRGMDEGIALAGQLLGQWVRDGLIVAFD